MSDLPAHTPYDGSSTPFTIGLRQLDPATWLEVDRHYEAHLAQKRELLARDRDIVFRAEPATLAAQEEVFALVRDHLIGGFPSVFPGTRQWEAALAALDRVGSEDHPPLLAASLLVQEDLVLMRRGADGWRLAAASLCFPASWSLDEKFGRPLDEIHEPVPGFGAGSRPAELIARMFDYLRPERPVTRMNWSIQTDTELHKPMSSPQRNERAALRLARFGDAPVDAAFIRVERQTLRKLPESGDVLFTIRIFVDPMAALARHPDRAPIARSFATQLAAMDADQLAYKGLSADRDRLVAGLEAMAGEHAATA
ncbi:MAG: heme-dependent oxidative N-demethylase family protein [Mesorhizobium sp.]